MTTVASSSSKGGFPFGNNIIKFDEFISDIPCFYSSSTVIDKSNNNNTFRSNTISSFVNDPELYMGDDCDTSYETMLMNSDLINLLSKDIDGFTKTNQDLDVNIFSSEKHKAQNRLEMLLAHVNTTFLNSSKGKGKEK